MSNRSVRTAVALLVASWLPAVAHGAVAPPTPADLVGTWTGTWKNLKFKSTGTINATIATPDANTLTIQFDVQGGVFGCSTPASNTLTLTKGTDFTDTSVNFMRTDPVFGDITVTSLPKGNKLTGGGTMACGDGSRVPSWKFTAKYKKSKAGVESIAMKFAIKLAPHGKAKSVATATKQ